MILIRNDKTIHHETGEWFDSRWHFSFENYRATDPANEHFGAMRVFNDNRVLPGGGQPPVGEVAQVAIEPEVDPRVHRCG